MNGSRITRVIFSLALPATFARLALLASAIFCWNDFSQAAENNAEANDAIDARLLDSVKYLASDELEGRGIGTKGIDAAAEYLAGEFEKLGLKTQWFDGQPFQTFSVNSTTELGEKKNNRLTLTGPAEGEGKPQKFELKLDEEFSPLAVGGSGKFDAPMVFAGYGITAEDLEYDDYDGIDAKGKIVVMLRKEPQQANPHSKFNGTKASEHATFRRKVANAFEHEAAGVIIVNDNFDLVARSKAERKRLTDAMQRLNDLHTRYAEIEDPSDDQFNKHVEEVAKLSKQINESAEKIQQKQFDQIVKFREAGVGNRKTMPVFFVERAKIEPVVQAALGKSLAEIETAIDADLKPQSGALDGWKANGQAEVITRKAEIKNVVGVLEGEGPLAEETVIVGAHYDHLGMGGAGTFAPWTVAVHNGADDNASGTAALLEVARQLAASEKKPRRRIVFIAFSGEERGLLGSAHYVKNPRFPLASTVAMINMDMVGRLKDNKLIVQGIETAKEFDVMMDRLNEEYKFEITPKAGGYGPSDHASFYPKKIPVMHLFTGTHKDYHRPSDDWDKVNIEGMRRIAGMVTDITLEIANADTRPEYVEIKRRVIPSRGGDRPYLGTIPDFANAVEGYALQDVTKGGPADKGGMKGGDVIVKFGESKIGGLEDIDSALRKYKAGDTVDVVVLRDGKEVSLKVVLDPPK